MFKPHCGSGQRIVGLELHHRPEDHSKGGDRLFGQGELGEEVWIDPCRSFVSGIEIVAERFDDMIEGAGDVGHLRPCQQGEQASQEAEGCADFPAVGGSLWRGAEVVSEQFVCAVYQVEFHCRPLLMFEVGILVEGGWIVKADGDSKDSLWGELDSLERRLYHVVGS